MERLRERRDRLAVRQLDLVLVLTAVGLLLLTAAFLFDRSLSFALVDRSADTVVHSLTALAAASLAALALARYRESGRIAGLFQASAFLLMALLSVVVVAVIIAKREADVGLTLGLPEQLPVYISSVTRVVAGALLLIGGAAGIGMVTRAPLVRRTLLAPVVAISVVTVVLYAIREFVPNFDAIIPPFIGDEGIQRLLEDPTIAGPLVDVSGIALFIQSLAAALFLAGAFLYRRSFLRDGPVADGFLAVAMLIGFFSEIHFYFYPAVYGGLVTTSEVLRLAFFGVLLFGINAESRADLRALRSAYAALDRMRQSEAERATLEERTRLARELHDGLAQDLWFAKLKHERLAVHVPEEHQSLAAEVTQAIDAAIAEAKQAVMTMRSSEEREVSLEQLISRTVDDFASRSGVRADLSVADLPTELPARTQAEVLRVLQEALTNVRRHADATVVRVSAEVADARFVLRIVDNGRGFRPDETSGEGLGVQGMKERARLMGGDLKVMSEPAGGTAIQLMVPMTGNVAAS